MKNFSVLVLGVIASHAAMAGTSDVFSFKVRAHQVYCQTVTGCTANSKDPFCRWKTFSATVSDFQPYVSLSVESNTMFAVQPFAELPFNTTMSFTKENTATCQVFDDVRNVGKEIDGTGEMITTKTYHQELDYCREDTHKEIHLTLGGKYHLTGHRTESRRAPDSLCLP